MNIVFAQYNIVWEDKSANHEHLFELFNRQSIKPGSLIVLPEMFDTGFSFNIHDISDSANHASLDFLALLANKFQSTVMAGIVTTAENGKGLNQAIVVNPKGYLEHTYTKLHPFTFSGEDHYFNPGKSVITFTYQDFQVAPFICYDLRFPEIFRIAAGGGAQLMVVMANWPSVRAGHWHALLKARAIENQAFVLGVNRIGSDPNLTFAGGSTLISPQGDVLCQLADEEVIQQVKLDSQSLQEYRQAFPVLKDMRKDL